LIGVPAALTSDLERSAINIVRGLAMDAPLKANSGHQGTAMTLAPLAQVLYGRIMRHDPTNPLWPDRDRFVLSNGHASILQYSMLYLSGYGLEMDDLKQFRQWGSATPGHPEVHHTAGVEVTTGPLGQGFANAVGMAIAERQLSARFGTDLIDHHTFVIAGDGCFMEGISHESASLAGHLGLGKLICIHDDNHITIDGSTSLAYSDDVAGRFAAYGWHVESIGEVGEDLDAIEAGIRRAMAVTDRPSIVILRSHIGFPSPDFTDAHEAHGNPFKAEHVSRTKAVMGIPDEPFWAPAKLVKSYRAAAAKAGQAHSKSWAKRLAKLNKSDRAEWDARWGSGTLAGWETSLPTYAEGESIATRVAIQKVMVATKAGIPGLTSGAADLTGNTGTKIDEPAQSLAQPGGRQVYYGVREHGMGAALVGMALHGGVLPVAGTFFVFSDYMKPSIRLAALSQAKCVFIFTHDSVGVGEDGPTHQPVDQLAMLRAIPGLQVIRPADANETAAAWRAAVEHNGPTALVLSRQNLPVQTDGSAVDAGAGVVIAGRKPQIVLAATGSEVSTCVAASAALADKGVIARVVSLPSWDRFALQTPAQRRAVFPKGIPVLSVEAATTFGWARFADDSIGIDRFGASAPGNVALENLGINPANITKRALALIKAKS
jgi:transketolase